MHNIYSFCSFLKIISRFDTAFNVNRGLKQIKLPISELLSYASTNEIRFKVILIKTSIRSTNYLLQQINRLSLHILNDTCTGCHKIPVRLTLYPGRINIKSLHTISITEAWFNQMFLLPWLKPGTGLLWHHVWALTRYSNWNTVIYQ